MMVMLDSVNLLDVNILSNYTMVNDYGALIKEMSLNEISKILAKKPNYPQVL